MLSFHLVPALYLTTLCLMLATAQHGNHDYCNPDTRVDDPPAKSCLTASDGTPASCNGSCGRNPTSSRCHCDNACIMYKDCCPDIATHCPNTVLRGNQLLKEKVQLKLTCTQFKFIQVEKQNLVSYSETVSLISSCSNGDHCLKTSIEDLTQPNLAVPITDQHTGLHYVNYYCAKCNAVRRMTWWLPRIVCETAGTHGSSIISNVKSLKEKLHRCSLYYLQPPEYAPGASRFGCRGKHSSVNSAFIRNTCPRTCANTFLINKCERSVTTDYFQDDGKIYQNYFCAMCANNVILDNLSCFKDEQPIKVTSPKKELLGILYRFDLDKGLEVGDPTCPAGQHGVLNMKQTCEDDSCPKDFITVDTECIPISHNAIVSATLYFTEPEYLLNAYLQFKSLEEIKKTLIQKIISQIDRDARDLTDQYPNLEARVISSTILNVTMTYALLNSSSAVQLFDEYAEKLEHLLEESLDNWLAGDSINGTDVSIHTKSELTATNVNLDSCKWEGKPVQDFQILNNSVILIESQTSFENAKFRLFRKKVFICSEKHEVVEKSGSEFKYKSEILTGVIVIICIVICVFMVRFIRRFKRSLLKEYIRTF